MQERLQVFWARLILEPQGSGYGGCGQMSSDCYQQKVEMATSVMIRVSQLFPIQSHYPQLYLSQDLCFML